MVVIKPDGVEKNLIDEIISRYEGAGLKVVAKKELTVDMEFAGRHYAATDSQVIGMGNKTIESAEENGQLGTLQKRFGSMDPKKIGMRLLHWSKEFITSGKVVALLLEGEDAVRTARKVTGFTDPSKADKGTIRGDLSDDSIAKANAEERSTHNLVHASGDPEEAKREIELWFGPEGLFE